ncbi:LPXTG cell wall anchor domain-containing protein [Staphylococcus aureus]
MSHDHKLPETGEQSSNLSIITFLASLTLIIGILLTFRRFIKPIK